MEGESIAPMFIFLIISSMSNYSLTPKLYCLIGSKRDAEDRIIPRSVDADDSDVDVKSDDER